MFAPPTIFCRAQFPRQITQIAAFANIANPVQVIREGHSRFRFSTSPSPWEALRRPDPPTLACTRDHTGTPTDAKVPVSDTRRCRAPSRPPCLPRVALGRPPRRPPPPETWTKQTKTTSPGCCSGRRPLSQRPRPPGPASKGAWTASPRAGHGPARLYSSTTYYTSPRRVSSSRESRSENSTADGCIRNKKSTKVMEGIYTSHTSGTRRDPSTPPAAASAGVGREGRHCARPPGRTPSRVTRQSDLGQRGRGLPGRGPLACPRIRKPVTRPWDSGLGGRGLAPDPPQLPGPVTRPWDSASAAAASPEHKRPPPPKPRAAAAFPLEIFAAAGGRQGLAPKGPQR